MAIKCVFIWIMDLLFQKAVIQNNEISSGTDVSVPDGTEKDDCNSR